MWRRIDPAGQELIVESEAFLAGTYAEHLIRSGEHVPAWAWTNLLAHGAVDQLTESPSTADDWAGRLRPWFDARAYVAQEVLDASGRWGGLSRLQRLVLVPLELSLCTACPAAALRPSGWASMIVAAVEPRPAWRRQAQEAAGS